MVLQLQLGKHIYVNLHIDNVVAKVLFADCEYKIQCQNVIIVYSNIS